MNKDIALKILEINNNNSLSYEEKISSMESLAGEITTKHSNILTNKPYAKRNQYILEAFKTLNNFTNHEWIAANTIVAPQNSIPIEFSILTKDNKVVNYRLFNTQQIQNLDNAFIETYSNSQKEAKTEAARVGVKEKAQAKDSDSSKVDSGENSTNTISNESLHLDSETQKLILNCIKEFNGCYGRTGIAKILKGSETVTSSPSG